MRIFSPSSVLFFLLSLPLIALLPRVLRHKSYVREYFGVYSREYTFFVALYVLLTLSCSLAMVVPPWRRTIMRTFQWLKRMAPKLALVFGAVLVTSVIGEVVLRSLERANLLVEGNLLAAEQSAFVLESPNSMGYRDQEFTLKKPKNTFRILLLGDSFTWGEGVPLKDIYPEVLEGQLNAEKTKGGLQFECINTGKKGLNTVQELAFLREKGFSFEPDLVLLGFVLNDVMPRPPGLPPLIPIPPLDQALSRHSHFYVFLKERTYRFLRVLKIHLPYAEEIQQHFQEEDAAFHRCVENLARMRDECARRKIPFLVVVFPFVDQLDDYTFTFAHTRMKNVAQDLDLLFLDLLPTVKGMKASDLTVSVANKHPNARGHALFASAIERFLREKELLPRS
jgi:lysophospholipase L1-like esterase